jgi:5-methyltetrahydrofolate--homocysteine methyltransferase
MLDVNGFEALDLGIDLLVQKFVDTIKETSSTVVGLSGFLTLAFDSLKETVDAIKQARLRDEIKIMIGGSHIDDDSWACTSANAYVKGAMAACAYLKKGLEVRKKWRRHLRTWVEKENSESETQSS